MSSDDQRIGVDEFLSHARPVDVDQLDTSLAAPWSRDVGLASLRSATYGVMDVVITHGNTVQFGHDTVIAEQMQPEDGGRVMAIDVAELGWPPIKAKGAALAKFNPHKLASVDKVLMAEWSVEVYQADSEWAAAAGFDGDDVDAMIAAMDDQDESIFGGDSDSDGGGMVTCPNCGVVVPGGS